MAEKHCNCGHDHNHEHNEEVVDILDLLYNHGWDERNGGNLSCIISEEETKKLCDIKKIKRVFKYDFDMEEIVGTYFLITGTGTYFKNMKKNPEENIGLVKVIDKNTFLGYNTPL